MNLRLTDEQDQRLQALADALHVSKHEAVIRAIDEQAERVVVSGEVAAWTDRALDRYRDLLGRLAQ